MITAPDPCDPASLVDEFARISRTVAVVLSRDLIKNLAVTTCSRFWWPCHSLASVHARYCDRPVMVAAKFLMRCCGGGDVVSRCLNYRPGHYTSAAQPVGA
jgi:hypothetical protein